MSSLQNSKAFTLIELPVVSKCERKAFTLIELLVVVGIIALLVGIMVPAVQKAMDMAKDGVVKTQFHAIGVGLEMFKQDRLAASGQYPDSMMYRLTGNELPGYVSLAVNLLGKDLRGYCPTDDYEDTNAARREPYIKLETTEIEQTNLSPIDSNDYEPVLFCKWGQPILYFRAVPGSTARDLITSIYYAEDNLDYIGSVDTSFTDGIDHSTDDLVSDAPGYNIFYNKITNPDIPGVAAPYNLDGFILWSAGKDQRYGTDDDITNFGD